MARAIVRLILIFLAGLAGCDAGPSSGRGFTLPEGNSKRGREAFIEIECHACHTVAGVERYEHDGIPPITVALGGPNGRVRTYGELVTSIINPSHRIAEGYPAGSLQTENGQSKMVRYNDIITVNELIDLVAFLQSKYELVAFEPTDYPLFRIDPSTAPLD